MTKQIKDTLAGLLAFLFTEDQKENPMPPKRAEELLKKIKHILYSETNEQHTNKDNQ